MPTVRKTLRGRFVRQQLCASKSVADLIADNGPWAGLLFERMILWQDDEHRFVAEPVVVKSRCFPWHDVSVKDIWEWMITMARLGMVGLYAVRGVRYGFFPTGGVHQPKQRRERFTPSELPPPPARMYARLTARLASRLSDVSSAETSDESLPSRCRDVVHEAEAEAEAEAEGVSGAASADRSSLRNSPKGKKPGNSCPKCGRRISLLIGNRPKCIACGWSLEDG